MDRNKCANYPAARANPVRMHSVAFAYVSPVRLDRSSPRSARTIRFHGEMIGSASRKRCASGSPGSWCTLIYSRGCGCAHAHSEDTGKLPVTVTCKGNDRFSRTLRKFWLIGSPHRFLLEPELISQATVNINLWQGSRLYEPKLVCIRTEARVYSSAWLSRIYLFLERFADLGNVHVYFEKQFTGDRISWDSLGRSAKRGCDKGNELRWSLAVLNVGQGSEAYGVAIGSSIWWFYK